MPDGTRDGSPQEVGKQADVRDPPPGFSPTNSRGKFTLHNGPIYRAHSEGDLRSGFYVLDRHCNGMGFLHGGMISAFADGALAWGVWNHTRRLSVTLKLTLSFLDIVRLDSWVEADPVIDAVNGEMVHAHAMIAVDGAAPSARADAVFRLLRRKTP
ncbi:MAG: PaaI family thioesterase [Pseudomonadota bacterium]